MDQFWDSSWENLDPDRLTRYIDTMDMTPDDIIAELLSSQVRTVCDAGCGCGIYSLKLAMQGFSVSGFDISARAIVIAEKLLKSASSFAFLKVASVLDTGYENESFDAVISRDVLDHMTEVDCRIALKELYRIVKPKGMVLVILDHTDEEYETEPHRLTADGDYVFTAGKWKGMVFHPYTKEELLTIIPYGAHWQIDESTEGITLKLIKPAR